MKKLIKLNGELQKIQMYKNMKKFISFSGGVESSTMCVLFGKEADAVFADTGFEHKILYERIELIQNWVRKFHRKDFIIHLVKNLKYASLKDYIIHCKYYPSFKSRYCTRMFKIEPIDDFLEQFKEEGVELMIGLNADEIDQRTGNHGNKKFVNYSYPLANNGITRDFCKTVLKKANLLPHFPVYMSRGGCIGCYYKSLREYEAMCVLNPEEFKIVEDLEEQIQDNRENFFSILKGIPMKNIREYMKMGLFDPKIIYAQINDVTACGVFCNR